MIPLRLHIKNFLSYGADVQTIDFSPYHLICFSGKNGHGKSALLDAITWALWGQARKIGGASRADQGLVRLGQSNMFVILDFICNNTTYRIKREFSCIGGKQQLYLEFGYMDERTLVMPLTDKTVRLTQAKIEQTVKLSYESFINSAFIKQGQSHEFSKKTAKERKEVLASILGLDDYELIRRKAVTIVKELNAQREQLQYVYNTLQTQSAEYDSVQQRATIITTELQQMQEQSAIITQELQICTEKIAYGDRARMQLPLAHQSLVAFQEQHDEALMTFKNTRVLWKQLLCIDNASLDEVREQETQLQSQIHALETEMQKSLAAREQITTHSAQLNTIEQEIRTHRAIEKERLHKSLAQIHAEQAVATERLRTITIAHENNEKIIMQCDARLQEITDKLASAQNIFERIIKLRTQFERRKEFYHRFNTQGTLIKQELDAVERKTSLSIDDSSSSCPLCEQNLSASRKRFLSAKFERDEYWLRYRMERLIRVVNSLKTILLHNHQELEELTRTQTEHAKLAEEQTALRNKKTELDVASTTHLAEKQELCATQALLADGIWAHEQRLQKFDQETAQIITTDDTYTKTTAIIAELENSAILYATHKEQLATTQHTLQSLRLTLATIQGGAHDLPSRHTLLAQTATLNTKIKQLRVQIVQLQETIAQCNTYISQTENTASIIRAHEQQLQAAQTRQHVLLQELGAAQHTLSTLENVRTELHTRTADLAALQQKITEYTTIAHATGKDGIQALLIEDAIPEIEQEANQLLARLTNNQASIFIDSLRDLKKGGAKETLDIKISDEVGIRPYEMFSGGEAFRIDFALRISISKLLARRAGTRLQTLIIDEGFGSQDEEGLGYIVDAMHTISDEFDKVIIVSHLPLMKEQFPVHFCVEKRPHGSVVSVIEHG